LFQEINNLLQNYFHNIIYVMHSNPFVKELAAEDGQTGKRLVQLGPPTFSNNSNLSASSGLMEVNRQVHFKFDVLTLNNFTKCLEKGCFILILFS